MIMTIALYSFVFRQLSGWDS